MIAEAVIFDKDGTLIDFDAFWVSVSVKAIEKVLDKLDMRCVPVTEILEAFGVHDAITDIEGVLCKGTYEQLGQIAYEILKKYGCTASCDEVTGMVIGAFNDNTDAGIVKPTSPQLADVLSVLKHRGKKLAVVTTDNEIITRKCLKVLGVEALFDAIYTDDGIHPTKPDPYCVYDICERFSLDKSRVVMVGDTMTDVRFAKNAGISVIGIAKTEKNKQILAPYADAVVPDPASLLQVLD